MSFYSYNEGTLTFKTKEDYQKVYDLLTKNHWYCEERDCFLGEMDEAIEDGKFYPDQLQLVLPPTTMRNFTRWMNVLKEVEWEGQILGYSIDGCFDGWIITPEGEKSFDLFKYAKKRGYDVKGEGDEWEIDLMYEVAEIWLEEPDWEINSVKYIKNL